jgi:short-subunit dehydrogenase
LKNEDQELMKNRIVLLTGGTSGIGEACVSLLGSKGHKVFFTSRTDHEKIQDNSCRLFLPDIADELACQSVVKRVVELEGRLDVLINNAGFGVFGPLELTDLASAKRQFDVNFFGSFNMTKAVLPIMRSSGKGLVINISSVAGEISLPFQGMYSASKAALESMSEALSMEVEPHGIRIVIVQPGDCRTGFGQRRFEVCRSDNCYAGRLVKTKEIVETNEFNGCDPAKVALAVAEIINSDNPPLRRVVAPFVEKNSIWLKKLMPGAWFRKELMKYYGCK